MEVTSVPMLPVVVSVCLTVYGFYSFIIYPLFLHPLRHVPRAHWSVAFPYLGSLWILYQRYRARNNKTTYEAHLRRGHVVRLAYNELSVNCVDGGIRTIYGGGWEKHDWYPRQFANYNVINMFSTVGQTPHSQKKRTLANIYSKSNLQVSPQLKSNSQHLLKTRFLPLLQSVSESGESINVHDMNNAFTMDFMSSYLFGIDQSTNFTQDLKARKEFMHHYHSRRDYEWHSAEIPPVFRRWLKFLRIPIVPASVAYSNEYVEAWNTSMCTSAEVYLTNNPNGSEQDDLGNEPVVYKHFKSGISKLRIKDPKAGLEILPHIIDPSTMTSSKEGVELMSKQELYSEMLDHLGAGHETSAIALTYLYWELCNTPVLQDRLNKELLNLEPQIKWPKEIDQTHELSLPEAKVIDSLPFLHAVMMETLRLHAPIPGNEPRVSPYNRGGSTLGSYSGIPGGVRVSSMAYTLHRNPDVFPQPEYFNPDRWLTTDEAKLKEMHRWFWAFGSGGRMCIGSHLAMQEIKLLVAAIYTNWKTEIVDDEGIEELDVYTTRPRSNRLMLRFLHR